MRYDPMEAGMRIKRVRERMGYTQEEMSLLLHTTRNYLAKLETGARTPSIDLWIDISVLTGETLDYLIMGTETDGHILRKDIRTLVTALENFEKKL